MTVIRLFLLLLVGAFSSELCVGKETCMTRWLLLSGIPRRVSYLYEVALQHLNADEITYGQTSAFLYRIVFNKSPKHAPDFLRCLGKKTRRCKKSPPCANGGICLLRQRKIFYCKCKKGFVGKFCHIVLDGCRKNPCQHGGRCKNRLGNFICHCPTGYEGRRCEKRWLHSKVFKPIPGKVSRLSGNLAALKKKVEADILKKISPISREVHQLSQTLGSMYTRWAHDQCPHTAKIIYKGFMAGGIYGHHGNGANHLCMPFNPIYEANVGRSGGARIYGAEYQNVDRLSGRALQDKNVPCAVCQVEKRSKAFMMPARNICPKGWVREYHGYLMAGEHDHNKENYICMDKAMKILRGHSHNTEGDLVYSVEAVCGYGINCGPYKGRKPLTCAFCTK